MIIGLTGGIGSGKSTVAELFAKLDVPIIDTDIIAREIVEIDKMAYHDIIKQFGVEILNPDQTLDRTALKQRIINSNQDRLALEAILHPRIFQIVQNQLQQLNSDYCIVVIPLLVETDRYTMLNRILVVDAPREAQMTRITQRDGADKTTILKLIAIQATREERLTAADDVILNDQGLDELNALVQQIHDKYMNLCSKFTSPPLS